MALAFSCESWRLISRQLVLIYCVMAWRRNTCGWLRKRNACTGGHPAGESLA